MIGKLAKKGIKLKVSFDGKTLIPEEDGYLGEGIRLGQFNLQCSIRKREKFMPFCFSVDGKKNVTLMKERWEDDGFRIFYKKISVVKTDFNILTTRYSENNFRVLISESGGNFEIWEIAIVSQNGFFFLTTQRLYDEAKWYKRESKEIVCPRFEWETKWPQLLSVVRPIFEGEELSPISGYIAPSPIKAENLPPKHGVVVWWNIAQGLGAIILNKKGTQARVHWKGIILPDIKGRLRVLLPGQIITYNRLISPSQSNNRTTGFLFEAVGVKYIER